MSHTTFSKEYSGEELADLCRDVQESFDPRFNNRVIDIPNDINGLMQGHFTVTIEWEDE